MTDRPHRRAAVSGRASRTDREDNPFAPPPEGQPDQPWQPRQPVQQDTNGQQGGPSSAPGSSPESGSQDDASQGGDSQDGTEGQGNAPWGGRWSSQQPGRQSGGFGGQGGDSQGGLGGTGSDGGAPRGGLRWDPSDPLQRRARYALHAGIWGLFFSLLSLAPVALLLAGLSLYWGVSALRGAARTRQSGEQGHGAGASAQDIAGSAAQEPDAAPRGQGAMQQMRVAVTPQQAARSQTTAAISGLVTAVLALAVVASTFAFQMVYQDYFTCQQDALTQSSQQQCEKLLPEPLRPFLEEREG